MPYLSYLTDGGGEILNAKRSKTTINEKEEMKLTKCIDMIEIYSVSLTLH